MPIASATDQVNIQTTERLGKLLTAKNPKVVAILGLTYKPYTPVTEESQAVKLLDWLSQLGTLVVFTHDPFAKYNHPLAIRCPTIQETIKNADSVLIATAWGEYRSLQPDWFQSNTRIVDCWSVLSDQFRQTKYRNLDIVTLGMGPA
jgi:UDPglucose 6-dehydrogenase